VISPSPDRAYENILGLPDILHVNPTLSPSVTGIILSTVMSTDCDSAPEEEKHRFDAVQFLFVKTKQ
jgi:hypothetical protein